MPAPGHCGGAARRPEAPPQARTAGRSGSHADHTTWHRQTDPAKGYARSPPDLILYSISPNMGLQFRERLLVQGVQVAVGSEPAVDVLVDLPGRHPAGCPVR